MFVVNRPIMLSILKLLAKKYSQSVPGTAILDMIGQNRGHDIKKCLQYLVDKHYVVGVFSERGGTLELVTCCRRKGNLIG